MPEGSSSAAPVTNPAPSNRKNMFLGFLDDPEEADSVISHLHCGAMRAGPQGSAVHATTAARGVGTNQEEESCTDRLAPPPPRRDRCLKIKGLPSSKGASRQWPALPCGRAAGDVVVAPR